MNCTFVAYISISMCQCNSSIVGSTKFPLHAKIIQVVVICSSTMHMTLQCCPLPHYSHQVSPQCFDHATLHFEGLGLQ